MERAVPSLHFVLIVLIVNHCIVLASYSNDSRVGVERIYPSYCQSLALPAPTGLHPRG